MEKDIWAKSNGETLKEHTENVKRYAFNLLCKIKNYYLPNSGLLTKLLSDEYFKEFKRTLELIAIYHDFGKIYPYFQKKRVYNPDFYEDEIENFHDIPHSFLSPAFFNYEKVKEFNKIAEFLGFKEGDNYNYRNFLKIILSTIAFHHWRENFIEKFLNKWELVEEAINRLRNQKELLEILKGIDQSVNCELNTNYSKLLIPPDNITFLFREIDSDFSKNQKFFFILLKGFLHRADHFASAFSDDFKEEIEITPLKAEEVENRIKKNIKKRAKERYGKDITNKYIWQLEKINGKENENIFLKATTGVGKTEFALFWSKGKKLIYVLPIRTAVNAMWKRLKDIFGEDKVGLLHSDALFYLEEIREHSRDENISESFISYDLAKNLSYPVIVATADQFFTAGLKYPGYEKIYSTLAYSYVVLDEIQLYEPRIAAIIIKVLEEIVSLGGKFCIMSATLPEFYKKVLEKRLEEKGVKKPKEEEYIPKNLRKHKLCLKEGLIRIKKENKKFHYEFNVNLFDEIKSAIEKDNKVLIVLNTVRAATTVYEYLKKKLEDEKINKEIKLIHSQFTQKDKACKEEIFESGDAKPDILVATQVAEVSLDIDYDVLFTELAPLDSLVQRMGRILRRHRDDYIYNEKEPNVYICGNIEEDKKNNREQSISGVDNVYSKEALLISYNLLKTKNDNILSEVDKIGLVDKFYQQLKEDRNYFSKFGEMLDLLDSLYSAGSKKEAQDKFRNIIQLSGIPSNKLDEFIVGLNGQIKNMEKLLEEERKVRKEFKEQYEKCNNEQERKILKDRWRKEVKKLGGNKRKINSEFFSTLRNALVNLYPGEKINKTSLSSVIKIENKEIKKWLNNVMEGIFYLLNVEYDSEKGAIVKGEETII